MKRSSPLRRRKPLRRTRWFSRPHTKPAAIGPRKRKRNKYARRPRDREYMAWIRRQPCIVGVLQPYLFVLPGTGTVVAYKATTPCSGPIEADHMGERGLGQKAGDDTCAPMCRGHHRQRTDHTGTFRPLTKAEVRAWRGAVLARVAADRARDVGGLT